jgi:hypothetical protein
MKANDLVTHKKLRSLGIGCVSKVLKSSLKVNFGTDDVMTIKGSMLNPVDTSKCKTITFNEFRSRILLDKSTLNKAIVGNELLEYVGIGWITERVVTHDDLNKYPRVIE